MCYDDIAENLRYLRHLWVFEQAQILNEQRRRRFVALEAQILGRGGVSLMARISGLARSTIYQGLSDIRNKAFTSGGGSARRVVDVRRKQSKTLLLW
jgi:DNA-binding phage protein